MDNIGAFASHEEDPLQLPIPPGTDEQFLFSVPMTADAAGLLTLTGSEALEYPAFEVLVWTSLVPVPASEIDFGDADLRLAFGEVSLNIKSVPGTKRRFAHRTSDGLLWPLAATTKSVITLTI